MIAGGDIITGKDARTLLKMVQKYNDIILSYYYKSGYQYEYIYTDAVINDFFSYSLTHNDNYEKAINMHLIKII